jgi:NhaP-type Na+/H+ or K+/H+ antiporter
LPLGAYLGGVLAVLVAALWSSVSSWKTRSALAHALSLGLFVWGGFLAAREVLPRIGYAKRTAEWVCAP